MKRLAITGFSRSGTTALTDLLNIDPRIHITYENCAFIKRKSNKRRKWKERNARLKLMEKDPVYMGDKTTRPYLEDFEKLQKRTDKIIFCLRDPRDIFRSKYWKLINGDPPRMYIFMMGKVLECDLSKVFFVRYEWAVNNVEALARSISAYLGLDSPLDITDHNYKPVRRFGWKREPEVELPEEVYHIMGEFGYENNVYGV